MASKFASLSVPVDPTNQLKITDLADLLQLLKRHGYSGVNYYDLGLYLGLSSTTLDAITKKNEGDIESRLRKCLTKWLEKADNVQKKDGPTIYSLILALRGIGENAVADGIDMEIPVEQKEETEILQETETVHTCTYISKGHIIFILIYTVFLFFIIYTSYEPDSFIAPLPGVEVTRSTNVIIPGGVPKQFPLKELGLVIISPPDAIPAGFFAVINIRLSIAGPYVYPDSDNHTMIAASPVYWLSSNKEFLKPLKVGIRHYASEKAAINVNTANDSQTNMSYIFRRVANVTVSKNYAYFSMDHFSAIGATSNDTTFCGTLYFQKSHNIEFQWNYNFVMYKCWSGHDFAKKNWSVEIDNTNIEFEENSTEIELDIKSNPSKNWKAVAKQAPLLYTLENLVYGNVTSNMQFSLRWNGNDSLPTSEDLVFFLKGARKPKEITVTTQSISFWKQYKEIIILCIIIVNIIFMLIIGKCFPDYQKGTIETTLFILKIILIGLVIYLLSHFVPEIISNPLMALWTKLVGSP